MCHLICTVKATTYIYLEDYELNYQEMNKEN